MLPTSEKRQLLMRQLDYQRTLHVSPYVVTATTGHMRLPLETMYDFCLKGCAMYITAPLGPDSPLTQLDLLAMFDHLCNRFDWDAHPDTAALGEFPCKFLACQAPDSPRGIAEILETHRSICAQILARQTVLDAQDAAAPDADPARHARYRLHPLFRAVLVVMDRPDWQQHEVQLVRTGDDEDLRCGPIDFDPLRFEFYVDDDGDVLRGSFERVMALVMDLKQREDDAR